MDKIGTKYENGRVVHQYIDTDFVDRFDSKPYKYEDYTSTGSSGRSITYNFDAAKVTPHEDLDVINIIKQSLNARYGRKACSDRITTAVNKANMHRQIKKVIFNNPATIVIWADNVKTIVKCDGEKFDPEKGLAMAIVKRLLGDNNGYYYEVFDKWLPKKEENVEKKKVDSISEAINRVRMANIIK